MFLNVLLLAQKRISRRRNHTVLQFLICMVSLACAITSLSLYGSITRTNERFREDTYGVWDYLLTQCDASDFTDSLGLTDQLRKYPSELSGGEQQRVAIARSLIAKPELIFADEPTGNLDKATEEMTIRLLCDSVRKYGQTLILVTHNPEIAERMQERIVMDEGKLL